MLNLPAVLYFYDNANPLILNTNILGETYLRSIDFQLSRRSKPFSIKSTQFEPNIQPKPFILYTPLLKLEEC
ncbi:MAG: hypothetical protein ACI93P_000310 [bacterium]|jgi:hypothetical protein